MASRSPFRAALISSAVCNSRTSFPAGPTILDVGHARQIHRHVFVVRKLLLHIEEDLVGPV